MDRASINCFRTEFNCRPISPAGELADVVDDGSEFQVCVMPPFTATGLGKASRFSGFSRYRADCCSYIVTGAWVWDS
jgi:hypothetical protein